MLTTQVPFGKNSTIQNTLISSFNSHFIEELPSPTSGTLIKIMSTHIGTISHENTILSNFEFLYSEYQNCQSEAVIKLDNSSFKQFYHEYMTIL